MVNNRQAINILNTAIALDPIAGPAYTNQGFAHHRLGHYDEAVQDFDQAVESITQDFTAYRRWSLGYDGWEQYRRPMEDFDEAILIVPWSGGVYAVGAVANAIFGRESTFRIYIGQASEKGCVRTLVELAR